MLDFFTPIPLTKITNTLNTLNKMDGKSVKSEEKADFESRRSAWSSIQAMAPDVAAHMSDFARVFGKPQAARVVLDDGTVLLDVGYWSRGRGRR